MISHSARPKNVKKTTPIRVKNGFTENYRMDESDYGCFRIKKGMRFVSKRISI